MEQNVIRKKEYIYMTEWNRRNPPTGVVTEQEDC